MKVLDPGHTYELFQLDTLNNVLNVLVFVKREGEKYPGNVGHHPGTIIQDVLRCLINRLKYVDNQKHHIYNDMAIDHLRRAFELLEIRAAHEQGRSKIVANDQPVELMEFCHTCGHIGCTGKCR